MQLGFAILLPDEVHNAVRRWQLEIAQACGGNSALKQHPHITLKQPFHAKELEPVERYFDELVLSVNPMSIEIVGIDRFTQDEVVFLDVRAPAELEALRLEVLGELKSRFGVKPRDIEDARYRFHATLAYSLPPSAFARAWEAVREASATFSFVIEALGLFYYTGEEWILYKIARLPLADRP
jgi:2'-5' RNA ligase